MTKTPYTFSVLRYVHDPVSQEFANIGVAVFSKQERYLNAICTPNYGRISTIFEKIDGYRFRQTTRYIQDRVQSLGQELRSTLPFELTPSIEKLLTLVLPPDDSAFQFSPVGGGVSDDLDETLRELFARFVDRYSSSESSHRDDDEVWKVYREPLERRNVVAFLHPKKIIAPNFDYEFEHSWRNEVWHVYEPISFDLLEANSIVDKANRWLGRGTTLAESNEQFKIHLLLGEPQDSHLRNAFIKAQNILHKMPRNPEFVKESEAESFADQVASEIKAHEKDDFENPR
jgi:hypothetical protein